MDQQVLLKRLAELESVNDQLLTELEYLDQLMRSVGFTDGLATVKATAQALYEHGEDALSDEENNAA